MRILADIYQDKRFLRNISENYLSRKILFYEKGKIGANLSYFYKVAFNQGLLCEFGERRNYVLH